MKTPKDDHLAAQLRAWRSAEALTPEQAAAQLGVSLSTLNRWLTGRAQPRGQLQRSSLDRVLSKRDEVRTA